MTIVRFYHNGYLKYIWASLHRLIIRHGRQV